MRGRADELPEVPFEFEAISNENLRRAVEGVQILAEDLAGQRTEVSLPRIDLLAERGLNEAVSSAGSTSSLMAARLGGVSDRSTRTARIR